MKNKWTVGLLGTLGLFAIVRDARASNLDIEAGDSYPVEVQTTSPSGGPTNSLFYFNSTYFVTLSDANFLIDANYSSAGAMQSLNSVTITQGLDTGFTISGQKIRANFQWQGSGTNGGLLNAFLGEVDFTITFKINFTRDTGWTGGDTNCTTAAFTVTMKSSGDTMPYTSYTGFGYSFTPGTFLSVSNGFNVPGIAGSTCNSNKTNLQNAFSLGGAGNAAAMDIAPGYPTYVMSGNKVSGS